MIDVSRIEAATPVRGFHDNGAVCVNVNADTVNSLFTATHDVRVEGQTNRSTNSVAARHILISHCSGVQPHRQQLAKVYESFRFEKLWAQLSEALARLQGDPSSAQVLLPVIEVCAALLPRG